MSAPIENISIKCGEFNDDLPFLLVRGTAGVNKK